MKLILKLFVMIMIVLGTNVIGAYAQSEIVRDAAVFDEEGWKRVDSSVDRGLKWLASQQLPDGSFPANEPFQPGVTSLAVMAFLSRGHTPGSGPYGEKLDRAIDFVLDQQTREGLLFGGPTSTANWYRGSHTASYNHAVAGLMLGEAYGMTSGKRAAKIKTSILKALSFARTLQTKPGRFESDKYGWRYLSTWGLEPSQGNADLSVTGWYIMFYRSAKNAEFDVPEEHVKDAIQFVKACYNPATGAFWYGPAAGDRHMTRAMNGAGILALSITGNYDEKVTDKAAEWLLKRPFTQYNVAVKHDRYHYGAYYCSQAMFMLGGEHWKQFYPPLATTLIDNQNSRGYWQQETANYDSIVGHHYTTALAILSLTPPYQLLPIYQR
jgi:hypothetical protein